MSSRPNLRWQLLIAVIGFGLVMAILSYQAQTEVIPAGACTTRVPAAGGVFVEGIVGAPQRLNPLLSDPYPVERELNNLIFDGLTQVDESGRIAPALAEGWTVNENGRFIRFTLREDAVWHDGEPVTTADVAFTASLMQDPAFPGPAALQTLWQTVAVNVIDERTIEFALDEPYAPFLEATTRGILPAHRLEGVTAAALADHPFNAAPIGTGPFMVAEETNWLETGQLRLTPNPAAWSQTAQLDALVFRFFPDEEAMLAAFLAGDIHAVHTVPAGSLPDLAAQPGVRLFTAPTYRYTMLLFNLGEPTGAPGETAVPETAVQSVAVRQALAQGLNRRQLLDDVLNGQGILFSGPFLPQSWAYNPSLLTAYDGDVAAAANTLTEAGWTQSAAGAVRVREEAPLTIRLAALGTQRALATAVAAQWQALGVDVQLQLLSGGQDLRTTLDAGNFDVALVDLLPTRDPDLYDVWSQEAIVRGQNYGSWNNRRASEALENARQLWPVDARRPYYDTFLRLYDSDRPAITLYQHVTTYAVSGEVHQLDIGRITQPRERYQTFDSWFIGFRDVAVACPPDENETP